MVPPALGMAMFLGFLAAVMTLVLVARRWLPIHPELSRKLVHVTVGVAALSFPWLFDAAWPVLLLALSTVVIMAAIRSSPRLHAIFGPVLGGVTRLSLGEFYYPAAVALVFVLSAGDPVLYCIPLLMLTLADAVAALIGLRYGTRRFSALSDRKSVEGSFAFFTVAFLSCHIPLLLFTDTGRAASLLIALTVGLLVMLLEAIAWRGLDNLLIPLASYILLENYLQRDVFDLAALLVITAALFAFVMFWGSRTTLKDSALLGGVLVGYLCFSWGGWQWLVPPLVLFSTYTLLWPPSHRAHPRRHDLPAVMSVSAAGVVWLVLSKMLDRPDFLAPYAITFAAHLAMIGVARVAYARPEAGPGPAVAACAVKAWLVLFVPLVVVLPHTPATLVTALVALPAVGLASVGFYLLQPRLDAFPTDLARWTRQGIVAAVVSVLGLVPVLVS